MKSWGSAEHSAHGQRRREARPPSWMAEWRSDPKRDPLAVLKRAAEGRDEKLVEERNELMAAGDTAFFRGAAGVMASDLRASRERVSDIWLDICGDAHIGNFGTYGSPERNRVFDLNDFDEARRAPWEWDVCRLATGAVVVARERKLPKRQQAGVARAACIAYADTVATLASGQHVDRWYTMTVCGALDPSDIAARDGTRAATGGVRRAEAILAAAKLRTQAKTVEKLTDGAGAFNDDDGDQTPIDGKRAADVRAAFTRYRDRLPRGLRRVLSGYVATDVAKRPVGAGSLGLRSYIVLLRGRDEKDALVLQIKEATPSQLDFGLGRSPARHEGRRVVRLQRMLQGTSDPLLGWTSMRGDEAYYVRQFRDLKSSPELEELGYADLQVVARLCGTTLARAHARAASSDEGVLAQIGGYIGASPDERGEFCDAVAAFGAAYADVTSGDRRLLSTTRSVR